jgi:hypothetical protein
MARRKYLSGRVEPDGTVLIRTGDYESVGESLPDGRTHIIGGDDVQTVRKQGTGDYEFLALSGI